MPTVLQLAATAVSLAKFALPLMERLRAAGYDVEAMAEHDGHEQALQEAGFAVHPWRMGHSFNPLVMSGARRQLSRFLRDRRYDAVHSHCSFGGIAGNAVAAGRTPRLLYTQHGFYVHEGLSAAKRAVWLQIEKAGLRPATTVLCVSLAEQQLARKLQVGPPEKFVHIPGAGVRTEAFHLPEAQRAERRHRLRREWGVPEQVPVALTVSRLTWDKGYREMIAALKLLRGRGTECVLVAAGSGKDEAGIRSAIDEARLADIFRLLGWRNDIADLYCAADVFIFASHREGLPISPIEALASGLPVIAADIPGCREELADGRHGLLYPVGDAAALADALERLLQDGELRSRLAVEGVRRAEEFNLQRVLDLQVELYQRLVPL